MSVLRHHHVREHARPRYSFLDGPVRSLADRHALVAVTARVLDTRVLDDEGAGRDVLELFGHVSAEGLHRLLAARAKPLLRREGVLLSLARQIFWQRPTSTAPSAR